MRLMRSFRAQLSVFVAALLGAVLLGTLVLTDAANRANARDLIATQIEDDSDRLTRAIHERSVQLMDSARLLTGDFAFKRAYALADDATLDSALSNHLARVGQGEAMLVVDREGEPRRGVGALSDLDAETIAPLFESARSDPQGEAVGLLAVDGRIWELITTPLLAPRPIAWVIIGFPLDDGFVADFQAQTRAEISLLVDGEVLASTLEPRVRGMVEAGEGVRTVSSGGEDHVTVTRPLPTLSAGRVDLVVQRSLSDALEPFERQRVVLASLFGGALLVSLVLASLLAGGVSRPVTRMSEVARSVREGDLAQRVHVRGEGELAALGADMNAMVEGLAERDRTRDLLGKVVSTQVADELLRGDIELGGEERRCTVMFTDLRGFTSLCEGRSPREILDLLNEHFSKLAQIVDEHGGVVDKFIGDALMAVFGAPVAHEDDSARALDAARSMLAAVRHAARQEGAPAIRMGVGLATGEVVAGNMGSSSRLNYTVIGDPVNLASRLEGLCKAYGVDLISDAETLERAGCQVRVELDQVLVRGLSRPIPVFLPLGDDEVGLAEAWASALRSERAGDPRAAEQAWAGLAVPDGLEAARAMHAERCRALAAGELNDWDGVVRQ